MCMPWAVGKAITYAGIVANQYGVVMGMLCGSSDSGRGDVVDDGWC